MDPNNNSIKATYNALGQKKSVNDPNMGTKTFTYTGFGEVDTETDAELQVIDYTYDVLGRLVTRNDVSGNTDATFVFDTSLDGNGKGLLASESGGGKTRSFTYDSYSRPETETAIIDGINYVTTTQYDMNYGRIKSLIYPETTFQLAYEYRSNGYLEYVKNARTNHIYQDVDDMTAHGQIELGKVSNGLIDVMANYYEATCQMQSVSASVASSSRHDIAYTYDDYDNLFTQDVNNSSGASSETYYYDSLHRLKNSNYSYPGGSDSKSYNYDPAGNILLKSDYATTYDYGNGGNAGPNAVSSITKVSALGGGIVSDFIYDSNGNLLNGDGKIMTYNVFNKPLTITKNSITSSFSYGADLTRYRQVKTGGSGETKTTIYIDKLLEKVSQGNKIEIKHYIGDVAIYTETDDNSVITQDTVYVHRDRLGSVVSITDELGNVVDNKSYDPFGKPRKATFEDVLPPTLLSVATANLYSLYTDRGFTDHEHMDDAELIHMNGRVYDYNLGRFLSVDPFIQEPGNSQSMNPYSYIMNNPLAGTDPSGYASCAKGGTEVCVEVEVSKAGSRLKQTVAANIKENADGSFSITLSGSNGAVNDVAAAATKAIAETGDYEGLAVTNSSTGSAGGGVKRFKNDSSSGKQSGNITQGLKDARSDVSRTLGVLKGKNQQAIDTLLWDWYGQVDDDLRQALITRLTHVDAVLDYWQENPSYIHQNYEDNTYFGFVLAGDRSYNINLGAKFMRAPATGANSKASTFIHEASHFNIYKGNKVSLYGTTDGVFKGLSDTRWLADQSRAEGLTLGATRGWRNISAQHGYTFEYWVSGVNVRNPYD